MPSMFTCPICFKEYTEKRSLNRHFHASITCSIVPQSCASCKEYTPKDVPDYFRHFWDCTKAVTALKRDYSFSSTESYVKPTKSSFGDLICESPLSGDVGKEHAKTSSCNEKHGCNRKSLLGTTADYNQATAQLNNDFDMCLTETRKGIAMDGKNVDSVFCSEETGDHYDGLCSDMRVTASGVGLSINVECDNVREEDGLLDDETNDDITLSTLTRLLGQSTALTSLSDDDSGITYGSTHSIYSHLSDDELSQMSDVCDDLSFAENNGGEMIRDIEDSLLNRYARMKSADLHPAEEELFILITEKNLPPSLFDEIMKWANSAAASGYKFQSPHHSTCLKRMIKAYAPYVGSPPKKDTIQIANLAPLHIHRLNFEEQAKRVYSDPQLMEDALWTYNFVHEKYGELNTGIKWKEAELFVASRMGESTLPEGHYLAPVLLFDDETMTDGVGRLKARPIACSFGNINLSRRKNDSAWFLLSVIPPFPKTSVEKESERKTDKRKELQYLTHYHKCLEIVTTELHEVCSRINGTAVNVHGKGVVFLHFELFMIIGDTDGQDAMCCHYGGYSSKLQRMCRDCDVSHEECDNPSYECRATNKFHIQTAINRCLRDLQDGTRYSTAKKRSKQISQHMIHPSYYRFEFGGSSEGIHGALPFEILHVYYLGLMKYLLDFIYRYAEVPKDLKQWHDMRIIKQEGGVLDKKPSIDKNLRNPNKIKFRAAVFENRFRQVMGAANRQSDRSMPRMPFKNGVTSLTRLTGQEYPGLCLLTMVCLESLLKLSDEEEAQKVESDMALLLWLSLSLEQLLTQDNYSELEVKSISVKLTKYLELFQSTVGPWRELMSSCGLRLVKFHAMKHFPRQIRNYGTPHNFSGVYLESALKQLVKQPTKRTTRQHSRYEYDLLLRHYEMLIVRCAADRKRFISARTEEKLEKQSVPKITMDPPDDSHVQHVFPKQPKFCLVKDGEVWYTVVDKTKIMLCHPHMSDNRGQKWVEALVKTADEVTFSTFIECFYHVDVFNGFCSNGYSNTDYSSKPEHVTFRCHPNYRSHPYESRGWFDWAVVRWESDGHRRVPKTKRRITTSEVRLCLFAHMKTQDSIEETLGATYAVCQALSGNKRNHHLLSVVQVDEIEADVRCIPVDTLKEVAYVLPACVQLDERFRNEDHGVNEEEHLLFGGHPLDHKLFAIIPPRSTWGTLGWGKQQQR
jgi:hypothetical protein